PTSEDNDGRQDMSSLLASMRSKPFDISNCQKIRIDARGKWPRLPPLYCSFYIVNTKHLYLDLCALFWSSSTTSNRHCHCVCSIHDLAAGLSFGRRICWEKCFVVRPRKRNCMLHMFARTDCQMLWVASC